MPSARLLSPSRAARLVAQSAETSRGANLVFVVEDWSGHRAGQHVDLRLTAAGGYRAQRGFSISSAPRRGVLTLTIERLEDCEVSPYLVDEMQAGDVAELREPIGDWFVWSPDRSPMLLSGGDLGWLR